MTTAETPPIRVVVADDQTVIRESVATMLGLQPDLEVVGTAADGLQAVERAVAHRADVVLMDLNMPHLDGADATLRLAEAAPHVAVLVLTTLGDDESILRALDAGARGYLTKDAGRVEIAQAIRMVHAGQSVLDAGVQAALVAAARRRSPAPATVEPAADLGLTPRETDVLRLIAEGRTNREIARHLVVSEGTVKTHINNLFTKTRVADRAAAVALAYRHGLGPSPG